MGVVDVVGAVVGAVVVVVVLVFVVSGAEMVVVDPLSESGAVVVVDCALVVVVEDAGVEGSVTHVYTL